MVGIPRGRILSSPIQSRKTFVSSKLLGLCKSKGYSAHNSRAMAFNQLPLQRRKWRNKSSAGSSQINTLYKRLCARASHIPDLLPEHWRSVSACAICRAPFENTAFRQCLTENRALHQCVSVNPVKGARHLVRGCVNQRYQDQVFGNMFEQAWLQVVLGQFCV